jgi:hypothetical protein
MQPNAAGSVETYSVQHIVADISRLLHECAHRQHVNQPARRPLPHPILGVIAPVPEPGDDHGECLAGPRWHT